MKMRVKVGKRQAVHVRLITSEGIEPKNSVSVTIGGDLAIKSGNPRQIVAGNRRKPD